MTKTTQDLARAAHRLFQVIEMAGLENLARGVELGKVSWMVKCQEAMEALQMALPSEEKRPEKSQLEFLREKIFRQVHANPDGPLLELIDILIEERGKHAG